MIKNQLKLAWRNLLKDKSFTLINSAGLIAGIAITLLIISYVSFEFSYDRMHPDAELNYRLTTDYIEDGSTSTQDAESYPAIAERIVDELPEVTMATRVYPVGEPSVIVKIEDQKFILNKMFAADATFFKMFEYPLLHGSSENLFKQPNEAVITESVALKLYGRTDVVGEVVNSPGFEKELLLTIKGVVPDSPVNSHLKIEMLMSYPTMLTDPEMQNRHGEKKGNWNGNNTFTYVKSAPNVSEVDFMNAIGGFSDKVVLEEKRIDHERIIAQKVTDIHLHSQKTFEPETNGDYTSVMFLLAVAFLVILSAIINYVNLATSKALERAREVGVKKIMGSSRIQLGVQFMLESFILTLGSAVVAVSLVAIFEFAFIDITGLPKSFSALSMSIFWWTLIGIVLIGSFLAGIYPALVLSSFEPLKVLRGKFAHSKGSLTLRKSLVVFQFAITTILIIQTFTVNQQLTFLRELDKGADVNNTIVIETPTQKDDVQKFKVFKEDLLANSAVENVSLSHTLPGLDLSALSTTPGISPKGVTLETNYNFYLTFVDDQYFDLLDIPVVAGKAFDASTTSDKNHIVVNEETLDRWNITSPEEALNKIVPFWGREWTVVGVAKNYHQQSPKAPHIPMIHMFNGGYSNLATIKFVNGVSTDEVSMLKDSFNEKVAGVPFTFFFLDEKYDAQYRREDQFRGTFLILASFSILIACLGLLGLATFTVAKRKKEIGIRKVIGASTSRLVYLLSAQFVGTAMIAVCIATPLAYLILDQWLQNFTNQVNVKWWFYALPILLVLTLVVVSVGFKITQLATANPVKNIQTE